MLADTLSSEVKSHTCCAVYVLRAASRRDIDSLFLCFAERKRRWVLLKSRLLHCVGEVISSADISVSSVLPTPI